jgi:predicted permease
MSLGCAIDDLPCTQGVLYGCERRDVFGRIVLQTTRYASQRNFGGVEQIKEECGRMRGTRLIEEFWRDLGYGIRMLVRSPGFTAVAVFSLALGIGANIAVLGLVDMVMFRPFPVHQPNQLAIFTSATSYPDYLDYKERNEVFTDVMAHRRLSFRFSSGQHTKMLEGESVSASYFAVLGLKLPVGRSFLTEEAEVPGSDPVAILSYRLWQGSFGSDPMVLGKTVHLNGESLTIVGVAPKDFRGTELYGPPTDIWIPLSVVEGVMHFKNDPNWHDILSRREARWLGVMGRLKRDTTLERAQAAITIRARQLDKAYGKPSRESSVRLSALGGVRIPPKSIRLSLALLVAIAGFVLLIVCTNVANLLVARASVRQREISIRLALGASRARLVRQLLTESIVLSGLGMGLGFLEAIWTIDLLSQFPAPINPHHLDFVIDHRILGLAVIISLFTCIGFGLAPAVYTFRPDPGSALRHMSFALGHGIRRSRLRKSLVASQVATSVILLIGAGLLLRTLWNLQSIDPGFNGENLHILSVDLNTLKHGYDESKGIALYRSVLERVRSVPGVRSAVWAGDAPLAPIHHRESFVPEKQIMTGDSDWIEIECNIVTPHYFEMLGIPLLRGRDFSYLDNETAAGVVIVNETMARRYWPGVDPIGKGIRVRARKREVFEVVGVAKDAKYRTLSEDSKPYAYFPLYQRYYSTGTLHVNVAGPSQAVLTQVRREIEAAQNDLIVSDATPLAEQIAVSLSQQRLATVLLGMSGTLALILATVGVYGVMAYSVAQRTPEIGIRLTLGARQTDILNITFREGMRLVLIGLGIGMAFAVVLSHSLASWIYGVRPIDITTYIGISLLFIGTASFAIYLPARRAAKVDPTVALRHE